MRRGNALLHVIVVILLIVLGLSAAILIKNTMGRNASKSASRILKLSPQHTPTPSPFVFTTYTAPSIQKKQEFTIVMIGDSMTYALGPHGGTFHKFINDLYKPHNIGILIDNYAQGAKNILQVDEQLNKETTYWDATFPPLLSSDFDLILIESFGYNPLSQFGVEEGVKKQTDALDELMKTIITNKPNAAIVFVATIAPNRENYANKVLFDISPQDRVGQAEERMTYIKNHIEYAKSHNLPLVNIYEKSLDQTGSGDLKYINPDDFIHPSLEGIDFIGSEIAQYIYNNHVLPW